MESNKLPERPSEAINSPQKLMVGALCLIFGLIFSVMIIERLGYIALIFGFAFSICLIYFMYYWLLDRQILKNYRSYRDELLTVVIENNPEYEKVTDGIISNTSPKNIMVLLSLLMLVSTFALSGKGRALSLISIVLFVIFFSAYIYFEIEEGKTIVKEIETLENEINEKETLEN